MLSTMALQSRYLQFPNVNTMLSYHVATSVVCLLLQSKQHRMCGKFSVLFILVVTESTMFLCRCDFIIYQHVGKPPENITKNQFEKKVITVFILLTLFIPNTHRCVVAASYQIRIGAYLPTCPLMRPCCGHIE